MGDAGPGGGAGAAASVAGAADSLLLLLRLRPRRLTGSYMARCWGWPVWRNKAKPVCEPDVYACDREIQSKYSRIHTDMHIMQECILACIQDKNHIFACIQD
jgi:hypothetical protein